METYRRPQTGPKSLLGGFHLGFLRVLYLLIGRWWWLCEGRGQEGGGISGGGRGTAAKREAGERERRVFSSHARGAFC
jgi:hypothetical protein